MGSRRRSSIYPLSDVDLAAESLSSTHSARRDDPILPTFSPLDLFTWASFEVTMIVCQFAGFAHIFLVSHFYGRIVGGIKYDETPNYHGLFMTYGLVFFNGEAILAYRFMRNEAKILSKLVHATCHTLAISFFSAALAQIIHQKTLGGNQHVYTFHSWFGIAIMAAYIIQFLFGLFNYGLPGVPIEVRQALMPYHRTVGLALFGCSVAQVLLGHFSFLYLYRPPLVMSCYAFLDCDTHFDLIFNFSLLTLVVYALLVMVLVTKDSWKREKTPEELGLID
ncbi:unnamed protein product, partial [Mesorhabditis belari]|uniref:Cytochrome b561 domain-containing protein n=1 Tax=Mesorhabditis belari TaxID=2138241 RepID=A0AAF3FNN0_9BILA